MTNTSPSSPAAILTVCSTCTDTAAAGEAGIGGGARLLALLTERHADAPQRERVEIRGNRCLMACTEGCIVALSQPGKMQYLLGRWPAEADSADAILAFAQQYAASASGVVPNADWPPLVAMRFLGRIPPTDPAAGVDWRDDGCDL